MFNKSITRTEHHLANLAGKLRDLITVASFHYQPRAEINKPQDRNKDKVKHLAALRHKASLSYDLYCRHLL
jgi:hypothetical protein